MGGLPLLRLVLLDRNSSFSVKHVEETTPQKLLFPFSFIPAPRYIVSLKNI